MLGYCVRKTAAIYSNCRTIGVVFTFKYESISPVLTMSRGSSKCIKKAEQKNNVIPRMYEAQERD